jgi:hypothetical protein
MSLAGVLILAASAATGAGSSAGQGVEILSAQVRAEIVRPAIVRQASGLEQGREMPAPQISRRGGTVLIEFQ